MEGKYSISHKGLFPRIKGDFISTAAAPAR
jgi:hypothetical protein